MSVAEAFFWLMFVPFYLWLLWPQFHADYAAWRSKKRFRREIDEIERHMT